MVVLDASIALAWCFPDEQSPYAETVLALVLQHQDLVPGVWPFEITNAFWVAEKRGCITKENSFATYQLLESLTLRVDNPPLGHILQSVLPLAREYGLSAYDAAYLELALREHLPLATLDIKLKEIAKKLDIPLAA